MLNLKLINKSDNQDPTYSTEGAAGFDLRANEDKIIMPGETQIIGTGLFVEVPTGYSLDIQSRSGLAAKGVVVANSPGLIDSDYRGELKVILRNGNPTIEGITEGETGNIFKVNKGDRIAQGVVRQFFKVNFVKAETLTETKRGEGGIGSTGVN